MKTAVFIVTLLVLGGLRAFADGYPFDPETQAVDRDTIRLRLSEPQIVALSATGVVTLDAPQLALIHHFYPNAVKAQAVVAATFNDNLEGRSDEDVDVFWVAAEEIAITLNAKVLADRALREAALTSEPHPAPCDLRIGPDGRIYIAGKPASLKEARAIIVRRSAEPGLSHRQVDVCVAPPFRTRPPDGQSRTTDDLEQSVTELFTALTEYGEANNVVVANSW